MRAAVERHFPRAREPAPASSDALWTLSPSAVQHMLRSQRAPGRRDVDAGALGGDGGPDADACSLRQEGGKPVARKVWKRVAADLGIDAWSGAAAFGSRAGSAMFRGLAVELPTRDRGAGAFAARALPRHTLLGPYAGAIMSEAEISAAFRGCSSYEFDKYAAVADADSGFVCSAWGPCGDGSLLRRINAPAGKERPNTAFVAASFRGCMQFLFVVTTRPVAAGDQLLIDYGAEYWQRLRVAADEHRDMQAARAEFERLGHLCAQARLREEAPAASRPAAIPK
jgi:hypothetical protein